jgi:hypothetical protein
MADNDNQSVKSSDATTTTTAPVKTEDDPDPTLKDNPALKNYQKKQQKERGEE